MHTSKLLDLFVRKTSPNTYHVGGLYLRNDYLDMAVLDVRQSQEDMENAIFSCVHKLSDIGHIFIPSDKYDQSILKVVNSSTGVSVVALDTHPDNVRVIYKNDTGTLSKIEIFDPAFLPWVHSEVCTTPAIGPVDVVYTIADSDGRHGHEELLLSLRSVERYATNIGKIWVVSKDFPTYLSNINHISCADTYNNCKDANIITKLLAACSLPDVSDRFIFMSDDQVLNSDIDLTRLYPVYNDRGLNHFSEKQDRNKWTNRMIHTLHTVESRGGSTKVNWDSHVPQPIDKNKFRDIMLSLPYTTLPGLCVNTAYFGTKLEPAVIAQNSVKNTFESECKGTIVLDKPLVGYNDKGYESGLREVLFDKFPNKSKYEKE